MGKVYTYALISVLIIVSFSIFDIDIGANPIGDLFGIFTGEITFSAFFDTLFDTAIGRLTIAGLGVAMAATLFTRAAPENYILLPIITTILVSLAGVFQSLITESNSGAYPDWIPNIIIIILIPLLIGFLLSMAEFLRGTD